jgi:SAM-dependent methyltransferase/rhodanese-related sulfurtransferase
MTEKQWDAVTGVADLFSALLRQANDKFLELGKLTPDAVVLDLACGAGALSRMAQERMGSGQGRVIAVDSSQAMIDTAKQRSGERPNLKYQMQDAHELPLEEGSIDVVYARNALPFFTDPARVLSRAMTVLKPGGRVAIMGVGGREHNDFFMAAAPVAPSAIESSVDLADRNKLTHLLEAAGFEEVSARNIRALVTVSDPQAYWDTVRGVLGVPEAAIPGAVADRLGKGRKLPIEFVFALGKKRDPKLRQAAKVKRFEDAVAMARRRIQELTPNEVRRNLKRNDVVYLDVREPDERAEGKLKGTVHMTRGDLEEKIGDAVPDMTTPILVYSGDGRFGALAAARLVSMGYQNVWNLFGGFASWKESEMPIEPL